MLDRLYLPFLGLAAIAVIALSLVWPQGQGSRSPGPFGETPQQQTPEMRAAIKREQDATEHRMQQARDNLRALQSQAVAPNQ